MGVVSEGCGLIADSQPSVSELREKSIVILQAREYSRDFSVSQYISVYFFVFSVYACILQYIFVYSCSIGFVCY